MSPAAFSVLGLFDSAELLLAAIPGVKAKTDARLDAYTPHPIHGIEKALGLRKSPIGGMVFIMGLIGAVAGVGFQLWTSGVDYPVITAGKPFLSWQAFVPIMFEITVLFATFTAGLGMLFLLNRLPSFRHPMLRSKSMPSITRDRFALAVESDDGPLKVDEITELLRSAGATSIEVIEQPLPSGPVSPNFLVHAALAIAISCALAGYLTYWAVKLFPVSRPMAHMLDQPRVNPQSEAGMRLPVAGTVARGHLPYRVDEQRAAALVNPLPRTALVLRQGGQIFKTRCSVCHGILGNGVPTLTSAYGAKPANLTSQMISAYPDGRVYHVITVGKNAMPSHAAELNEDERWAVVHYVRVLQRALNARDEDVPK